MGGVYYLLQDSAGFDNLMHGKSPKKNQKQRSLEDFGKFPIAAKHEYLSFIVRRLIVSQLSRFNVYRHNTRSQHRKIHIRNIPHCI